MLPTTINVAGVLVLVLPGFLAYRFAVLRRVDPSKRSALWQLSEILEYSLYVHFIGLILVSGILFLLRICFGVETHIDVLLDKGLNEYLKDYLQEAVLWFSLYTFYVILASALIGSYDLPRATASRTVLVVKKPASWLATRHKWLAWVPVPQDPTPQEPVWYYTFNTLSAGYTSSLPQVLVRLKSGDVYSGELASYPITLDTEHKKDFLIRHARYYKDGDWDLGHDLSQIDPLGAVLLNTANVDSIVIYYKEVPPIATDQDGEEGQQ